MDYVTIKNDSNEADEAYYYGQCRCCLAAGNHRDITQEYYWNGYKEVYCDIILDCFNIFMPTNINTLNLICDSCVDRLRNANEFKQLVVSTEQQFMDTLLRDEQVMFVNVPVPEHTLDSTIGFKIEVNNANNTGSTDGATELDDVPTDGTTVLDDDTDHCVSPKVEIDTDEEVNEEMMELEVLNDVVSDQIIEIPPEDIENEVNNTNDTENVSKQIVSDKMAKKSNKSAILENSNITDFKSRTRSLLKNSVRQELKKDLQTVLNKSSAECKNVANNTSNPTDGTTVNDATPTFDMDQVVKEEMMELVLNDDVSDDEIEIPPEDMGNTDESENEVSYMDETENEIENDHNYTNETENATNEIVSEKMAHIANVSAILENSNITAFKSKTKSGFPCFYCKNIFKDFKSLRDHQRDEDLKKHLRIILNKYSAESLVVFADVTDLICTLCDNKMADIKELKHHLVNTHGIKLYNKVTERVIPFKLTENYYECQICNFYFETFKAIESHMNTHMRNYVCDNCDDGFVTASRLKIHIQTVHKEGKYPCDICAKIFTTMQSLRGHRDFVHKTKRKLKCPLCPERFSDYVVQQKHLEKHGKKPILYKCNLCSKAFNIKYELLSHMNRKHSEGRDIC